MKTKSIVTRRLVAAVVSLTGISCYAQSPKLKMTTDIPKSITAPNKVETSIGTLEYFDGVPQPKTVETVYDYLDRSRAVEAFMNCIPAMSMYALREGQQSAGANACNKVCIFDTLMDSKSLFLTGNTSTMCSDYAMATVDAKKAPLDGSKTYKLHLPPNPPVKDFWAITMYDTQTRSQLQTDQQFPTLGSQSEGMKKNVDDSCDIYFAPEPPAGKEGNWLQTVPGKSWFIALRMYGPLKPWIDKTWRIGVGGVNVVGVFGQCSILG